MQGSSKSQIGKLAFAIASMVAMMGLGVGAGWLGINDLPPQERTTAWIWFASGWVLTAAISFGLYLPGFIGNRIKPQTLRQQAETKSMAKRVGIRAVGLSTLAGSLGLLGPGVGIAAGAIAAGLFTWMLGLVALHFFTKKGRAYRARQLEANRGLHSERA